MATLYSKVTITFSSGSSIGETLQLLNTSIPAHYPGRAINETVQSFRSNTGEVAQSRTKALAANNMYNSLKADLDSIGIYTISILLNVITIQAKNINVVFADVGSILSSGTVTVENHTGQLTPINFTGLTFSMFPSDPNNKVNVSLATNRLAVQVKTDGITYVANTALPYIFPSVRATTTNIWLKDSDGNEMNYPVTSPPFLSASNITIDYNPTPAGTRATISVSNSVGLNLQYSLDGTAYQDSNIFPSLTVGAYTLHVKDQYGAIVSYDFNIADFAPPTSIKYYFSYLSKSMSIRYKRNIEWNNIDIYRTDDNTLSCEENVVIPNKYIQQFKPENVVTTQFLSNYQVMEANVLRADGTKYLLNIIQKIKFLDLKITMDGFIYKIPGSTYTTKCGLYFTVGNYYDYMTTSPTGTYASNGILPEFGVIGSFILVEAVWYEVVDIIYDDSINADVLVLDFNYTGTTATKLPISANYNKKNFNVYEFDIDFSQFTDEDVQIEILQSSTTDNIPEYNYLSEIIHVSNDWDKNVELIWFNTADTMVFYSTGIKNIGNYEFLEFKNGIDSNLVINRTPSTTVVIEAENYEAKTLIMDGLTTAISQQVIEASLHKMLYVNKVGFVSSGPPEIDWMDNTNLSTLTLNLLRKGSIYNADWPGNSDQFQLIPLDASKGLDGTGTTVGDGIHGKGIIIPWYFYPNNPITDPTVQRLISLMNAHPTVQVIVVINPSNGPISDFDTNYNAFINLVQSKGGKVIGYVSTAYGDLTTRPEASVESDIDLWKSVYHISGGAPMLDGIFLDEMPNDPSKISLYTGYKNYCNIAGFGMVVGNPGAAQTQAWFDADAADVIIIHESPDYPDEADLTDYLTFPNPPACAALVYNQSSFDITQFTMLMQYVKWVYITDDDLTLTTLNPWDTLSTLLEPTFSALS